MPHDQIIAFLNTAINVWEKEKQTEFVWNPIYSLLCKEGTTGDEDCKKHVFLVKFERGSYVVAKFRRCNEGIQVKEAGPDALPWRLFEENMMDMNGGRRRKSRRRKSKRSSTKSKKNVRRRTARY